MDIIKSVIDIVKDAGTTVWKYVKYQVRPNDYVDQFVAVQKKLKHQLEDVEAKLNAQLNQPGKKVRSQVDNWREEVRKEIAVKVEDLISNGGYFTYIYSSSNLKKKTEELKQILEEGKEFTNFSVSLVIDDHSIKGVPLLVEECNGRDDVQEQILEWLKGDKVTRIAVWGMGGVGKTTIMKQVHNQMLKEPKFNKVIWVKVSKDFDIIVQHKMKFDILKFQKSIATSLELKLEPEDHGNESKLAGLISQKLGQGSYVLILDDVWQQFCLEDVGIPNLDGNNCCKLVLTTRSRDVARAMDCKVIYVNPLPTSEALALFLEKVGSDVLLDGKIKGDIKPFLEQVLQKCGGVPLAIVTVAKSMRGKLLPHHWKLALSESSKFESTIDSLKFSYEWLEPQCQECFLYCALYPKDYKIRMEQLIEYWIEEGLIYNEGKTREAMHWKGHGILDKLVDNCLLESVINTFGPDFVIMHDLLREMALEISPQFLVKAGMALEMLPEEHEWREDLLKVSLMENQITKIPSSMPSLKCPMLTTLLLSNNYISTIPEAFFEHMLGLKILDLSWNMQLWRLPSSVSKLEKLTTLLLQNCQSLREVPSLSNLAGLKKLDLSWTLINKLPQGLNQLTNLKYLGLGGRLSEPLDESIQNLCKLQHLMVNIDTEFKWRKIGSWGKLQNLENLVLRNLDNLNAVFGEIGAFAESAPLPTGTFSPLRNLDNLNAVFGKIGAFAESAPLPTGTFSPLRNLDNLNAVFEEIGAFAESAPLPAGTFSSLQYFYLDRCDKTKKLFSVRWLGYLQKLQTIRVGNCEQLEEIIGSESNEGENVTLPMLEILSLISLPQLKSIYSGSSTVLICNSIKKIEITYCKNIESVFWSGFNPLSNLEHLRLSHLENLKSVFDEEGLGLSSLAPPTTLFPLKNIEIFYCNQLKKVFSSGWLLGYFQFLETIKVRYCKQMEELISSSTYEEKVTLPKLQELQLVKLTQMKSICSRSSVLICDSIVTLCFHGCYELERLPLNFPLLDNAQPSHPPSLKRIVAYPKEWWESLEWDHPNAEDILLPFCDFRY